MMKAKLYAARYLVLALILCVSVTGCGSPDKPSVKSTLPPELIVTTGTTEAASGTGENDTDISLLYQDSPQTEASEPDVTEIPEPEVSETPEPEAPEISETDAAVGVQPVSEINFDNIPKNIRDSITELLIRFPTLFIAINDNIWKLIYSGFSEDEARIMSISEYVVLDIDNDGIPEILIKKNFYEGSYYDCYRLNDGDYKRAGWVRSSLFYRNADNKAFADESDGAYGEGDVLTGIWFGADGAMHKERVYHNNGNENDNLNTISGEIFEYMTDGLAKKVDSSNELIPWYDCSGFNSYMESEAKQLFDMGKEIPNIMINGRMIFDDEIAVRGGAVLIKFDSIISHEECDVSFSENGSVSIKSYYFDINMLPGEFTAVIDGDFKLLPCPPEYIDGILYVPMDTIVDGLVGFTANVDKLNLLYIVGGFLE